MKFFNKHKDKFFAVTATLFILACYAQAMASDFANL